MGETIILRAADGFGTTAYVARPRGKAKGALVVIQEIFGVNRHMRGVADGFARDGYVAIVPALFDRIRPGIQLGYADADIQRGIGLKQASPTEAALLDIAAARDAVKSAGKVGVVGYCWGGFLTWVACTRLKGFAAGVSYYGGGIGGVAAEKPGCPVQFHFGEKDHAIPMTDVAKVGAAGHRRVEVHVYPAGHGFNCDERGSFDAASARQARARAIAFFAAHVAGEAAPAPKAKAKAKAKTAARPKAKPKAKAKAPAKPKPSAKAKPKAAARPKAKIKARPAAKAKPRGKPKARPKARPKSRSRRR
jgi:carboxymethylenebutenolidase